MYVTWSSSTDGGHYTKITLMCPHMINGLNLFALWGDEQLGARLHLAHRSELPPSAALKVQIIYLTLTSFDLIEVPLW